jgi:hypothetical protein
VAVVNRNDTGLWLAIATFLAAQGRSRRARTHASE